MMTTSFSEEQYLSFSETDFLSDPFFQEWVYCPTVESESFWKSFLENHPEKKESIENAYTYLKLISFQEHLPTEDFVQQSLAKHLQAIQNLESENREDFPAPSLSFVSFNWRTVLKVAALFGGVALLIITYLYLRQENNNKIVQTPFGKTQHILLPDSSIVVLNANSKIEFDANWKRGGKREVWLNGEAFFDVKHFNKDTRRINPDEQFEVHTNDLTVTVLGTSFNVRQRRGKTEVVLQTGKIRISFNNASFHDLMMNPGDIISYDPLEKKIVQNSTSPEQYTSWKANRLVLQNPSVNEIVNYLEDNFGKKIILEDAKMGKRMLDGPILLNSLDDALFVLSVVLNTEVIKADSGTVVLRPR